MTHAIAGLLLALCGVIRGGTVNAADTPAPEPPKTEIYLGTKRDVAPGPSIRLSLNTRNLATISLAVYKLDTARWLRQRQAERYSEGRGPMPAPLAPAKPARVFPVVVGDPKLKSSPAQPDIYRSKQFNLPALPPGAYLLVASGGGKQKWTVVNVTNLAVVVKRAPNAALAWVTDFGTGKPVVGAPVTLWDGAGERLVARGVTGADGVCRFPARPEPAQVLIVARSAREQSDLAGLSLAAANPDGRLVSHLQTDRPVYRPGATMQYRAILRRTKGNGYVPEANATISAEVRDSRDNVLQRTEEKTGALGTLAGSFTVPAQGALGAYTLVLTAGDKQQAYATFSVAEYRKPDFQVAVTPLRKRYMAGEDARFSLQADYYFGAPLPGATVRYTVRRRALPFSGSLFDDPAESAWFASGDGNLYSHDTYAADEVVAESTLTTDAKGHAEIAFPTRSDIGDAEYSVSATVTDGQRREVAANGSVPVYAANLRLGVRAKVGAAPLNGVVPIELRIADLDGRPAGGKVTLVTRQEEWNEKKRVNEWHVLSQSSAVVPASGKATTTVPAAKQGMVELRATVKDATGRTALATTNFWVMDPDAAPETENQESTVALKLERPSYLPGDTVKVFLTTNTPDRPTLLTIEGNTLYDYVVVPAGRTGFLWKTPATLAMSPNAHITAAQWGHSLAKPDPKAKGPVFRNVHLVGGSLPLPVPDRTRRLDLTVTPDRTDHRPGDEAVYTIRARDGVTGKPVPNAEVALAVVDESVFAVRPDATPDLYGTFWGFRDNRTDTRASAPEEVSGGAYQNATPTGVAPVRQRFLDTAFWSAHLLTGPDGTAEARVELPGNLTSWRATALGVTGSTAVGRAVSNLTASRPVMLRLATPRQFVQGDVLTLIGTISNRTEQERRFEATLTATGVTPAPGESATQSVTIPAKGEAKVEWRVSAATIPAPEGRATLDAVLVAKNLAPGESLADYSDHLRVTVPVRPHGVATRLRAGAAMTGDGIATATLDLPADRIEPATDLVVTLRGGAAAAARATAASFYQNHDGYGTLAAADLILVAATPGAPALADKNAVRDALAQLSRYQTPQGGWGWWEDAPADGRITARVLRALRALRAVPGLLPAGVPFPDTLLQRGLAGGESLYNQTGLWEERAYLAPALAALRAESVPHLAEVADRNANTLSPAATLTLAKGLLEAGDKNRARTLVKTVLEGAVVGPDAAYIPAGERPGQRAGVIETTARALETLVALDDDPELQSKLARWLILPSDGDSELSATPSEQADSIRALLLYAKTRSGSDSGNPMPQPGDFTLVVNGTAVPWATRAPGTEDRAPLTAFVPRDLLKNSANTIVVRRADGTKEEAFLTAEATVYRPQDAEVAAGMRVLRRFEYQNRFGVWGEVVPGVTKLRPSVPVRVTVVVWPNETADALRITEPLPAGFEFVDSELGANAREEVRDGAVLHFLQVDGAQPVTFRYYLRAESEGTLTALPATGELIRHPAIRGGSAAQTLPVEEAKQP